jgi:hypothetical protein
MIQNSTLKGLIFVFVRVREARDVMIIGLSMVTFSCPMEEQGAIGAAEISISSLYLGRVGW